MKTNLKNNPYLKEMKGPKRFDRREFLKNLGGGVVVVYTMGNMTLMQSCAEKRRKAG